MKTKILLFVSLLIFFGSRTVLAKEAIRNDSPQGSLTIQNSPDLQGLITRWVTEYGKFNPSMKLNIVKFPEDGKSATRATRTGLSFVSNGYLGDLSNDSEWKMVVGRDAIVPVISSKNPFLHEILLKGISPEKLSQLKNSGQLSWGSLLQNSEEAVVHYYVTNDEALNTQVASFLKTDQLVIGGINVQNGNEMIAMILKDPYAIGFCPLSVLLDLYHQSLPEGISFLPIDKNGNGQLDSFEKIYGNVNEFLHGVWIGKFPGTLCRSIYAVSYLQPEDANASAFLKWVISDGQQYLNNEGYLDLGYNERQAKMNILDNNLNIVSAGKAHSANYTILIIIGILLIAGIMGIILFNRKASISMPGNAQASLKVFNPESLTIPKGLYFDKTHTWAFMEKNGIVRMGIDDFLTKVIGPMTRVTLKNPGDKIRKGEKILSVMQNGKQLNISSPISGTIKISNASLNTFSEAINESPYNEGWIYMIEPENWLRETEFLFMSEKYSSWIHHEFSRLKDFFASSAASHKLDYSQVVMQDGGELKENILVDFGPEVWEDFQTRFIEECH